MRPLPRPSSAERATAIQRTFNLNRSNGDSMENGKQAAMSFPTVAPKRHSPEISTFQDFLMLVASD
jgi:hypothetical protein